MSTKHVKFRTDDNSEMLEIYVDGELFGEGNYWDFDFVRDSINLLTKLDIDVSVEDYEYDDFDDEEVR